MPAPHILPEITEKMSEITLDSNNQLADDNFEPVLSAKLMETRDSISSIDSDVSLSFDNNIIAEEEPTTDVNTTTVVAAKEMTTTNNENEDEGAHMADLSDSASDTGSNGGGKDSGCEVTPEITEPIFTPPSEELADKIVQQVEFYFSDANITKDAFLLKHVKRNKEGYVSLKLISSFKRVKHITKDWRVVAHALTRSTKLEINEAGTKLRRLEALPQYDETTPSRTVVSVNMPIEKPTIENVAELFRACGEIALIRILRPGNPIPADVRQFINKNPSLNGMVCALVEFVASESARCAMQLPSNHAEFKVYELNCIPHPERKKKVSIKNKNSYNSNKLHSGVDTSDYSTTSCTSSSEAEDKLRSVDPRMRMRRGSSAHFPPRCTEPAAWLQRRLSASSTEASFMFAPRRLSYSSSRDSSDSNLFVPRRVSACSLVSENGGMVHYHQQHGGGGVPVAQSYYQRRMSACSVSSEGSSGCNRSRSNSSAFQANENVLRLPRGPDGSRGFRQRAVV